MVVEPQAGDRVEDNLNPVGRVYYGFSTLVCTPSSLSQPVGRALGRAPGRLSGFKTRLRALTCSSGCAFVLVDEASQDGSAPDSLVGEVRHGMIGARREETQRSVRAPFVVVGGVPSEDGRRCRSPKIRIRW